MSKTYKLTEKEIFEIWKKGWNSAQSIAEQAIQELIDPHREVFERDTVEIPKENFVAFKDRVTEGLYTNMPVSKKGGLDYYFAATDPKHLVGATQGKDKYE